MIALLALALQAAVPPAHRLSAAAEAGFRQANEADLGRRTAARDRLDAAEQRVARIAAAMPLDVDALAAAMAARDAVQGELGRERSASMIAILRRLEPADRQLVAGMMIGPPRGSGRPPTRPPAPPPPAPR